MCRFLLMFSKATLMSYILCDTLWFLSWHRCDGSERSEGR